MVRVTPYRRAAFLTRARVYPLLSKTTAVPSITKYIITPELYTTKYRAVGLGSASVWTRIGGEYNVGHQTCDAVAGALGNHCEFRSIATSSLQSTARRTTVVSQFQCFCESYVPKSRDDVVLCHTPARAGLSVSLCFRRFWVRSHDGRQVCWPLSWPRFCTTKVLFGP